MRTKSPEQAEKILKVAAQLFASQRFHEARMEDIAAAAEVGKGTLYRYFKDKEELYLALLNRAAEQLTARVHEAVEQAAGPRAKLDGIVRAIIGYFDEQPHFFDLIHHAEAMPRPEARVPLQQTRQENIRLVREVVEEAAAAGLFRLRDTETSVLMLLGGLRAVIRFGQRPRDPDLAHHIVENFLHGAAQDPCPSARRKAAEATRN